MRRKTFDTLVSVGGLILALVLAVAGGLLMWSSSFVNGQVHDQLAAQKIYFPAANSDAVKAPEFAAMRQYGGQLLTTGDQAEVYADHFIANHLKAIGGGQTYAQLSAAAMQQPNNAQLQGQVATMFKGETLRGMLLNAYAFGTMGKIAGIAGIVSFAASAVLLVLSLLGLVHARRTAPEAQLGRAPAIESIPAPATS
jgi:hypothetical protein